MKRATARGFTLIELLLVLGILAALMGAAFWLYNEVQFQRAVTNEARNLHTVVATVTSQSAAFRSTTYLGNGWGAKSTWSMNLAQCDYGWCNEFGGATGIFPTSCWTSSSGRPQVLNNGFAVSYQNLGQRECQALLSRLGSATPSAIYAQAPVTGWVVLCEPGTPSCSSNGTRLVRMITQQPSMCAGDFRVTIAPTAAFDVCSGDRNTFQLHYYPAVGVPR
ncbi:pilus assembly FimT family protein [Stenotrophomonas acidaminiphila]|uniref:pilus assembly FimT family protein n=1 Tax=Stenotrophomonas acidaminiphila TaxID=128780 RepID=UPI0020C6B315|nr:type II secretion system protein [Stenotrophomonas acidaminiphila]